MLVEAYPRLGWTMESPENGTRQTAYEIEIREACTGRTVWNTGKVQSSQSQLIPTHGAKFLRFSFYNYIWRVRVWDETDALSEWSREAKFRLVPQGFLQLNGLGPSPVKTHACPKDGNSTEAS